MLQRIRVPARLWLLAFGPGLVGLPGPGSVAAQAQATGLAGRFQEAWLPAGGQLWLEITPSLQNWTEQFALGSRVAGISDGQREPLFADFDGQIGDRLFPGIDPILAGLNADAPALGYDSLMADDVSLGMLGFSNISAQVRRIDLGLEFGVTDRLSVEARAPLVFTDIEISYAYDSLVSTMVTGASAVTAPESFFPSLQGQIATLQGLIDDGSLSPEELEVAAALLDASDQFRLALERRVMENQAVPAGTSPAGVQMSEYYQSLVAAYTEFGLSLPQFELPEAATSIDLNGFFNAAPIGGLTPASTNRGWAVAEIEVGARFKVIDTFGASAAPPPDEPETGGGAPDDPAGDPGGALQDPEGAPTGPGVRFRTTLGARARIPLKTGVGAPLDDPGNFLDLPVADGQPDIELTVYQDIAVKSFLYVGIQARYGLQLADERPFRIDSPDRRYAMAQTESMLRRDLGDYLWLRLSPQYRLTEVLSLGLEYTFWRKGSDRYTLTTEAAGFDPLSLELETAQTRHRLGIGAFYRMGDATDRETGRPRWTFGFIYQTAIAGSGGRTPAAQLITITIRAPIGLF